MNISPTDGGLPSICWSNLKATMRDVEPFLDMFGIFHLTHLVGFIVSLDELTMMTIL